MSYLTDKLVIDAHTDRQTQAATIAEGQNWPRVKTKHSQSVCLGPMRSLVELGCASSTVATGNQPSRHITQYWRRYYVNTTSFWRNYVKMTSFSRNNDVIIASCLQGELTYNRYYVICIVTCGTADCLYDNLRSHQWWQSWQHNNPQFSVTITWYHYGTDCTNPPHQRQPTDSNRPQFRTLKW